MNQEYVTPESPENSRALESEPQSQSEKQSEKQIENQFGNQTDIKPDHSKLVGHFRHFYFGSLLYALFFTFCLYKNANGITYPFFVGGTLFFFCSCLKKLEITAKKDSLFYVISLMLLGISTFLTNSEPIIFMNTIGIFLLGFSFAIHSFYDDSKWSFGKHFSAVFFTCFGSLSCLDRPFRDLAWYRRIKIKSEKNETITSVFFGLLIAIPLLIVILLLLYHADVIFADYFDRFFSGLRKIPEDAIGILFTFLFAFLAFYCIWAFLCRKPVSEEVTDNRTAEPIIAITFTSLISFIYLVFCSIQIRFLFLGNIPFSYGYNYSEYARKGFFQLLFVCLINLILVLICLGRFREHRVLKAILTTITVCTYVMIASSVMRMLLYIMYYNLTFLRIMVLCALLIIMLLITGVLIFIYKPSFPLFRFSMITVTVLYLAFSFSHPDYWIARYNTQPHTHVIRSQDLVVESLTDVYYLTTLSTDAAPVLLTASDAFAENYNLYSNYADKVKRQTRNKNDLRTFNLSRFIASGYLPKEIVVIPE